MPITISGDQTLFGIIGLFALLGYVRGWRKMGVVFVGTLITSLVLLDDETRLVKLINAIPQIVALLLDTKAASTPLVTAANRPYWLLGIFLLGLAISWVLSETMVHRGGGKPDFGKPTRGLMQVAACLFVGAGTGYLFVIKSYGYILALSAETQQKIFQSVTIVLEPLPKANILVKYESLLFVALFFLALAVIFGSKVYGKGRAAGANGNGGGGARK